MNHILVSSALGITLFTACGLTLADTETLDINERCKQHSIMIVKTLKQKVVTDMSHDEIKTALNIANQSCHEYFGTPAVTQKIEKADAVAQAETEAEEKTTDDDWFSKYVFEGNPHEKEGVKRLKNRKR